MRLIDADELKKILEEGLENKGVAIVLGDLLDSAETVEWMPTVTPLGVVKEYDNGMVAMRARTYEEYHNTAVEYAIKELNR